MDCQYQGITIIHRQQKICGLLRLAGGTEAEKFHLVGGDLIAGGLGHFGRQLIEQADFRVDDVVAAGTDQVRVGVGLVAIIAVAAVGQADFQDFTKLLQQVDGLVDRGQAEGGKEGPNLAINLLNARMLFGMEKRLQDGNALRCNPQFPLPEDVEDIVETLLRIFHARTCEPENRAMPWFVV